MFPMLSQKAMIGPATPILWDYHVILLLTDSPARILDFDTTLPFCSDLRIYLEQSFPDESTLLPEYVPSFRLIPAAQYIEHFRSDRSHMKTATGWHAPPPDWPPIGKGGSNLTAFTNMQGTSHGEIMSRTELLARYLAI